MFQWICSGCGRVWDVSVAECPDCSGHPRVQRSVGRAGVRLRLAPASRWVFMGGILALLAVAAYLLLPRAPDALRPFPVGASPSSTRAATSPALQPVESAEPLRDTVEVSGVRIHLEADGRARVVALVTNHGGQELKFLSCRVDLRRAGEAQRAPLASFRFEMPTTLAPRSFQEVQAPLELAVPPAALPDWRQLEAHLQSCAKQ